jgi:hypothetical protein
MALQRKSRRKVPTEDSDVGDDNGNSEVTDSDNPGINSGSGSDSGTDREVDSKPVSEASQDLMRTSPVQIDFPDNKEGPRMSIFGDLDVTGVDDDPFSVKDGTYRARCTDVSMKDRDDNTKSFSFKYKIEDEDAGIYNGRQVQAFFLMPDLAQYSAGTKITDMAEDDQQKVLRIRHHIRLAFDVPEAELNMFDPKKDGTGKIVYVTVKTNPDKEDPDKKYVNITKIESERSFHEKMQEADSSFSSEY